MSGVTYLHSRGCSRQSRNSHLHLCSVLCPTLWMWHCRALMEACEEMRSCLRQKIPEMFPVTSPRWHSALLRMFILELRMLRSRVLHIQGPGFHCSTTEKPPFISHFSKDLLLALGFALLSVLTNIILDFYKPVVEATDMLCGMQFFSWK